MKDTPRLKTRGRVYAIAPTVCSWPTVAIIAPLPPQAAASTQKIAPTIARVELTGQIIPTHAEKRASGQRRGSTIAKIENLYITSAYLCEKR